MATPMLVSIKSVIKGYHVYKYTCPIGTILQCNLEPENEHSDSAIIVKNNGSVVGHIPEGLCQPLTKLFKDGLIIEISAEILGEPRSSSKGTFVKGGGIEIPCTYKLYGKKEKKREVRSYVKTEIRKLEL
jgi:hypothetical protein